MGHIHLLADDVINKIAAGEVVERPASVVKELVENALDAGATAVEVGLELGGARSIVIADNGCGMSSADAAMALTRHATSKISGADDLTSVRTMGFRGEALAAIAAVSRFSLATTERGAACGVKLTSAGGEAALSLPWNGPAGTTVAVENLFFNMPARAKFLKASGTELSHVLELMQAFALCHPHVAFTLRHNGREQFSVPAQPAADAPWLGEAALAARARAVFGKDAASLVYFRYSSRHGDVEALVSPPGVEKGSGKAIMTFVNGRWVKDKVLRYGVLRGYHSHLLKGRFPVVIAHLRLDPSLVDVNVHPAKTEVRFQYPEEVQSLLALGIRDKLRTGAWAAPGDSAASDGGMTPGDRAPYRAPAGATAPLDAFGGDGRAEVATRPTAAAEGTSSRRLTPDAGSSFARGGAARLTPMGAPRAYGGASAGSAADAYTGTVTDRASLAALLAGMPAFGSDAPVTSVTPAAIPWDALEYLGAFARCYLFFACGDQLLAVDQHAFHERILYERLVADQTLLTSSQPLLVPEAIELTPVAVAVLASRQPALAARGFAFAAESATTVVVKAVPSLLAGRDLAGLFADLGSEPVDADDMPAGEPTESNAEMTRLILATAACHAAVRAGEELSEGDLRQLLAAARTVDFYHNCPHGRRVFRWWSRGEVASWFDR